jgi:hypothetical protein
MATTSNGTPQPCHLVDVERPRLLMCKRPSPHFAFAPLKWQSFAERKASWEQGGALWNFLFCCVIERVATWNL